jgi:hypothetical protein
VGVTVGVFVVVPVGLIVGVCVGVELGPTVAVSVAVAVTVGVNVAVGVGPSTWTVPPVELHVSPPSLIEHSLKARGLVPAATPVKVRLNNTPFGTPPAQLIVSSTWPGTVRLLAVEQLGTIEVAFVAVTVEAL